jgi:hypothetical protein
MSKPKIFIGGDSWACGEWPVGPSLHASHKGIEEYFSQDGYSVINTSRGGANNLHSISLLGSTTNDLYAKNDIIIWVQTDPIRRIKLDQLPKHVEQAGGIVNLMRQLVKTDYSQLNHLTLKYNCPVYVIGGLYSIQQDLLARYPRVRCLVESWVALLVDGWTEQAILDSPWTVDDLQLDTFKDQQLVSQCIDELMRMQRNRQVYENPIFHPNGNHPNREGHRILYNYIKERLEL